MPSADEPSLSDFIAFEEQILQMALKLLEALKAERCGRLFRNGQWESYPEAIIRVSARIERSREAIRGYRAALAQSG
jgi:hypothetical protein